MKASTSSCWMGVPATNAVGDWNGGDKNYLLNLFRNSDYKDKFLERVLETLFFDTLNNERIHDVANPILGENIRIPYLNGGLFEPDSTDRKATNFPADYFKELLEFFGQYNFTIDENDPQDAEVGIDPEMLGHIFENLLEDNKDKGAFYTPKEIVRYMCQQSLIEYLQTKLGKYQEIEEFIQSGTITGRNDRKNFIVANAKVIEHELDSVKICDPAIGSGAFPMGILSEIFKAKMALNLTLDPAEVKKKIIQNSIYGVDIEQGAVDIARLRFWLSLVVDEEIPQPLPNLDYKIMCGNSLLSRFDLDMSFDDVFQEYNKGKNDEDKISLAKYKELVADYTNTSDHDKKDQFRATIEQIKSAFRTELSKREIGKLSKLKGRISDLEAPMLLGERTKTEKAELKKLKTQLTKLESNQADILNNKLYENAFEWRFEFPALLDEEGKFMGFDIVIGNPPYGVSIKGEYRKVLEEKLKKVPDYEIYYYFVEIAKAIATDNGVLSYIIPNTYLFNTFADNYRRSIISEWSILEILDCSKFSIFESATVMNTINIWRKSSSEIVGYRNTSKSTSFIELINEPKSFISIDELLVMNQNWGLAFRLDKKTIEIVMKIKLNKSLDSFFTEISQGLIAYDKYKGQDKKTITERAYHYDCYQDGLKKWLWGSDVCRYTVNWNNKEYIDYCDGIANPRQPKYFKGKRILVREITNPSIFAAITDEELYNDPSVLVVLDSEKYSLFVALGILNSKLATFFHFNHAPKATKGAFPKILVKDIKEFPLPYVSDNQKDILTTLVDQILEAKKSNPQADTSALETEIDLMVYELYGLTEDEIAIIESKLNT